MATWSTPEWYQMGMENINLLFQLGLFLTPTMVNRIYISCQLPTPTSRRDLPATQISSACSWIVIAAEQINLPLLLSVSPSATFLIRTGYHVAAGLGCAAINCTFDLAQYAEKETTTSTIYFSFLQLHTFNGCQVNAEPVLRNIVSPTSHHHAPG